MNVDGQCHCGAIKFTAEIDPDRVVICHCTDCQVLSGTAYRIVAFTQEDAFHLQAGEPRIYIKTAQSGNPRAQGFCGDCGTPLYATSVGDGPRVYGLRAATLRQIGSLKPGRQVWRQSALHWVDDVGALPAIEQQP